MRTLVAALVVAVVSASTASSSGIPSCEEAAPGWCLARRIVGDVPEGELGFRFGEPLDVDGDGSADLAGGSRFAVRKTYQAGRAGVWSGKTGQLIRAWDWPGRDALFGHWVLPVPDLDGDGLADLLITAPLASRRGVVIARSPKTGAEIWRSAGPPATTFGWDLAAAGDHDSDGRADVFVGQPAISGGRVYLIGGKDGARLRTYAPRETTRSFGWFVAQVDDLDGDGRGDLAVGAPPGWGGDDPPGGRAFVLSSASGKELQRWAGTEKSGSFGEVVAAVGDLDGDHRGEIAVGASESIDAGGQPYGEVRVFSGTNGTLLRQWWGHQSGEIYGRMVVSAGDVDADGVDDLAIGAPWYATTLGEKVGRVEIRSGRTDEVLSELIGETANSWFGWHIRRAPDPDGRGRPALLISAIRRPAAGAEGVGALDLCVLRAATPNPQGTISRGARRSDIK